jgi:hypothetical protein
MNRPDLIQSSSPHFIAVDEGSRDAKGRKSFVVENDSQTAVNSDEMADAMDAANRKNVPFSADTATHSGTKKSIKPDVEDSKASSTESAAQDRPRSPPSRPKFQVAQPLSIQTPTAEINAPSADVKTTAARHDETDPEHTGEMAHALVTANRKKIAFSAYEAPQSGTKEFINPDIDVTNASVSQPADQDQPESPTALHKFQVAEPVSIHTQTEENSPKDAHSSVAKLTTHQRPEPDPHIAARLETLKAQNNAVRTSLDAFDSQSLAKV